MIPPPDFPETPYWKWTEEQKTAFHWFVRLGRTPQWYTGEYWQDDKRHNPKEWDTLRYRLKP